MEGRAKRGFTLFEIVLVITILLSLTMLISIKRGNEQIVLENTANEISSAIRYARNCYDSGDSSVYFTIAAKEGQYHARVIEKGFVTTLDIPIEKFIKLSKKSRTDEDESFHNFFPMNTKPLEIRFYPNASTGISILLQSEGSSSKYVISVVPTSSRVHLYKINE